MTSVLCRAVHAHTSRKCLIWQALVWRRCASTQAELKWMPVYSDNPFEKDVTEVIDVRTPKEYEKDHIPKAINLPILGRKERHDVGCLYSQSPFAARKLGAQIISQNISEHLSIHFKEKPKDYSALVYCWRGGQRSLSLGLVLAQIGFNVFVLRGGYKYYRKHVFEELKELPAKYQFRVISGLTGSGKTLLLRTLQSHGEQVLDLEDLANHRGSVLGLLPGNRQPTQKYWESLLLDRLSSLDTERPVWVESESKHIGTCRIPDNLFNAMCNSCKRYVLKLPLEERIRYIISGYECWTQQTQQTKSLLDVLRKFHGNAKIQQWHEYLDNGCWEDFVRDILVEHYDKTYSQSQRKMFGRHSGDYVQEEELCLSDLTPETLSALVESIL